MLVGTFPYWERTWSIYSGTPSASALPRVSPGWHAQLPPWVGSQSGTCEHVLIFLLLFVSFNCSSHCVGSTADGQDFESFIGPEKAKEMKALFSSWIHAVYRKSPYPACGSAVLSVLTTRYISCIRLASLHYHPRSDGRCWWNGR